MSSINGITTDMRVASMSYWELQAECKKANLRANGKAEDLRKRLRGHLSQKRETDIEADAEPSKHSKKSPSDDLTCPITLELPFDPVTAEDGRVYERWAIISHFQRHPTDLKSPVTNETMGRRLFPAVQTRNLIATLVETGAITGDLANSWKKKQEERKKFEDTKKRAEGGDESAMYKVGLAYQLGEKGMAKDLRIAFTWYKKAADAGSVVGTAMTGYCLLTGTGVAQDKILGMALTAMAAERGSNLACYALGLGFALGRHDLTTDTSQGRYWLRKVLSDDCSYRHLAQHAIEQAQSTLQELEDNIALTGPAFTIGLSREDQ